MKCFSLAVLAFITMNVCAADFNLKPGEDDLDGTKYYVLTAKNSDRQTNIDVALEGNANTVSIKDHMAFSCPWGSVEGVKIGMSSQTNDGVMTVDSYYFFDENLANFFSRSYSVMNGEISYTPLSLNHSVCGKESEGVKKDSRTGKDYIEDYEVISNGPYALKGVPNVRIKYVTDKGVNLIKESSLGDVIVDAYKNKNDFSPSNLSVFFMNISSEMNVVSLMSWGGGTHETACYKVYAYIYDSKGNVSKNTAVNDDVNLSGCDEDGKEFSYKNAVEIKGYLKGKFRK